MVWVKYCIWESVLNVLHKFSISNKVIITDWLETKKTKYEFLKAFPRRFLFKVTTDLVQLRMMLVYSPFKVCFYLRWEELDLNLWIRDLFSLFSSCCSYQKQEFDIKWSAPQGHGCFMT